MARSKDAPPIRWEWKNCDKCEKKFRYTMIEGTEKKDAICKNCNFKSCPVCKTLHKNRTCCSESCTKVLRAETNIRKYGSSNVFASKEIKNKIKETMLNKHGVDHPLRSDSIKDKMQQTCIDKYGVTNPAKSKTVKERMRKTCQEKYGTDFVFQSEDFKQNARQTTINKFGVEHYSQLESHKTKLREASKDPKKLQKYKNTLLTRYGVTSSLQLPQTREKCNDEDSMNKRRETMRKNRSWVSSKPEDELYKRLCEMFSEVQRHVSVNRWDIDFYIPEIDTFVNMNGIYWHGRGKTDEELMGSSSKQDKTILSTVKRDRLREVWFKERKKKLFIVWEDEIENLTSESFNPVMD